LPLDDTLAETYDPYAFIRDAYLQRRQYLVYDGDPPEEPLEEFEDIDDEGADSDSEAPGGEPGTASDQDGPVAEPERGETEAEEPAPAEPGTAEPEPPPEGPSGT
jgi:phospholipid-binding lipoprotein MlaA